MQRTQSNCDKNLPTEIHIEENETTSYVSSSIVEKNENPLVNHIKSLAGVSHSDQPITGTGIINKFSKLNMHWPTLTGGFIFFATSTKVKGCPFSSYTAKEGAKYLTHPMSTGIYNPMTGEINEKQWEKLVEFAEIHNIKNHDQELVITKSALFSFLAYCRSYETRPDSLGLAKQASNGEWEQFFNVFSNFTTISGEPGVTLTRLHKFFVNTEEVVKEIEQHSNNRLGY